MKVSTAMTIQAAPSPTVPRAAEILTPEALVFIEELHTRFAGERDARLAARQAKREEVRQTGSARLPARHRRGARGRVGRGAGAGGPPGPQGRDHRSGLPAKMAVNALNSGANIWLADLEDANTPTWHNVIDSQVNLADAARRLPSRPRRPRARSTSSAPTRRSR